MKKFSVVFLSLVLMLAIISPAVFAAVDTSFKVDSDLVDSSYHYPGKKYEYDFKPVASTDNVTMSLSITSGSKYLKSKDFKQDGSKYVFTFYVLDAVQDVETIEYKVTCKDKSNASNYTEQTDTFYVGFGNVNFVDDSFDDAKLDVKNNLPVYEFDDEVKLVTLNFENRSYYKANFNGNIKLNLYYSDEVANDIYNNNNASLEFMRFTAQPTFDLEGLFGFYAPDYEYLYTYNNDQLKLLSSIKTGDYFRFTTKQLGFYIVSDKPLSGAVTTSGSSTATSSSQGLASSNVTSSSSSSNKAVAAASTSKAATLSSKAAVTSSKATVVSSSKPVVSSSSSVASSSSSSSSVASSSSLSTPSSSEIVSSSSTSVASSLSDQATDTKPETTRNNGSNIILIIGAVIATVAVVSLTAALLIKKK